MTRVRCAADFTATRPLSSYITAICRRPERVVEGGTWSGGASDGGHAEARAAPAVPPYARALPRLRRHCLKCAGLDFFHERCR